MVDRIFISRRGVDIEASSWIAATLETHGYECVVQERDFKIGDAFPLSMLDAFENCETTIAILSPDYWDSGPCRDEWAAAYALDRSGMGHLIPVMLRKCTPPKLVKALAYLNLTQTPEGEKASHLIRAVDAVVKGRASLPDIIEPDTEPLANSSFHTSHFTGRSDELAAIHTALWGRTGAAAVTTPAAVHGLGGVGKSAIAREYARIHLHRYAGAWLVRAEQPAKLTEDFAALAVKLNPRLKNETDIAVLARQGVAEARQLARAMDEPFLLILDNVELPKDIPDYVRAPELHVLITSRYARFGRDVSPVEITELPPEPAKTLLLDTSDREESDGLAPLLEALSGLPLSLVQAGAYLRENPSERFTHYLEALETRIAEAPDDWPDDQKLVAATYRPSIERAEASAPGATELLMNAAFYDPSDIPIALLTDDPESEAARKAVDALARYSLIKPGEASVHGPGLSLHRLLQTVLWTEIAETDRDEALKAAAERLETRFSGDPEDVRDFPIYTPLVPHVLALNSKTPGSVASEPLAQSLEQTATLLDVRAEYAEAEKLCRQALVIREAHCGPDHPLVARSLNDLAVILANTNRASEAEPLHRRALSIQEVSLGPDHLQAANSLNNLAYLFERTNRANEAEPYYRRALAIHEASLGPDHPRVAAILNNLAALLNNTNRAREAEPIYRRALTIREASFGPDHPNVANSLNNLAFLLDSTSRASEAEPLHRRALAIREASFGPDHPVVATSLNNLADVLDKMNRAGEAEPLHRRALAIREAILGPDHPDVATSLNNLAYLLANTNRASEAEPLYRRALSILEASFGPDHPYIAMARANLTSLLARIGKTKGKTPTDPSASDP